MSTFVLGTKEDTYYYYIYPQLIIQSKLLFVRCSMIGQYEQDMPICLYRSSTTT